MKRNFIWIVLALICGGLIYARFTAFTPMAVDAKEGQR